MILATSVMAVAMLILCGCSSEIQGDILLVGTFTDTDSEGIYSFTFNQENGQWEPLAVTQASNPSFIAAVPGSDDVLCVSENGTDEDGVARYRLDRSSGALALLEFEATATCGPCYVSSNDRLVLTANYLGGSLDAFPFGEDGIKECSQSVPAALGGPHANQAEPHIHCAYFAPDGKYILATDFSADRVRVFSIGEDLSIEAFGEAPVKAGTGPRHIAFGSDGRFAYVIGELSGEITAFEYRDGSLNEIQTAVADSLGGHGSADIHLSADGKFLYASNRLKGDGIAVFNVDPDSGLLTKAGYCDTKGHPRNFCITPNGKYLLCACRDGDSVQIFLRDPVTGLLTDTCNDIPVPHPVCVMFP